MINYDILLKIEFGLSSIQRQPAMQTVRLTPYNVSQYIGYNIIFNHGLNQIVKRIERVSNGRKTVTIDYPPLRNNLEIVSRYVRVIV